MQAEEDAGGEEGWGRGREGTRLSQALTVELPVPGPAPPEPASHPAQMWAQLLHGRELLGVEVAVAAQPAAQCIQGQCLPLAGVPEPKLKPPVGHATGSPLQASKPASLGTVAGAALLLSPCFMHEADERVISSPAQRGRGSGGSASPSHSIALLSPTHKHTPLPLVEAGCCCPGGGGGGMRNVIEGGLEKPH